MQFVTKKKHGDYHYQQKIYIMYGKIGLPYYLDCME